MTPPDPKSPGLEVISREAVFQSQERRCLPRLSLASEQLRIPQLGKIFSVTDLSARGMGFWLSEPNDLGFFSIGLLLTGVLNLRREKYPVKIRVRNLRQDRVGGEFEDLSEEITKAILGFLDPALLGAGLKPIPAQDLHTLWYHGPSNTDFLVRRKSDGTCEKWTLYVLGSFIQWVFDQGISTGRILPAKEQSQVRGIVRLENLLLVPDVSPDSGKLAIAKTVILSSNLSQDLKSSCIRQLER